MIWGKEQSIVADYCHPKKGAHSGGDYTGYHCYLSYPPKDAMEYTQLYVNLCTDGPSAYVEAINMTKLADDHIYQIITRDGKKIVIIVCCERLSKVFKKELEQKIILR